MQQTDRVIAVTGAAGAIGRRLLLELEENGDQREVVALDTRPLAFPVHNVSAYRRDVAEPFGDILEARRVTTVVHLAFDARRGRSQIEAAAIRQSNLDALKSVLDSCAGAQVRHFILLSSHMAYGAYPDNPVPLRDDAPLRASTDFPYGHDKLLSEELVREFDAQHEDIAVTILRPCPVLGPNTHHSVARGMFMPMLLAVRGSDPPLQFLYEDDLARVLSLVISREIPGVFNVAGEGVVFYRELVGVIKSKLVSLPAFLAYPLVRLAWNLGIQRESTAAGLDLVRYPILLDTSNLRRTTGYRCRHTSFETLTAFANSRFLHIDQDGAGGVV